MDSSGHCFIAAPTQQNILRLWQAVISQQQAAAGNPVDSPLPAANAFAQPAFGNQDDRSQTNRLSDNEAVARP
jgi:hypothetical protein